MIIETKYSGACVMKGLSITHRHAQIDFSHLFYVYVCMYWFRQDLFFSNCVFYFFFSNLILILLFSSFFLRFVFTFTGSFA